MVERGTLERDANESAAASLPEETTTADGAETFRVYAVTVAGDVVAGWSGQTGWRQARWLGGLWQRRLHLRSAGPRRVPWLLAVPGIAFLLVFHFAAPVEGAWYAFTNWDGTGHASWVGLGNFREIWHSDIARRALWNTLELAAVFLVAVNGLGLMLALGLNRTVKSRHLLRSLVFLPVVLSPLASAYIWEYIFDYRGAFNELLGAVGLQGWERPWLGDPGWALWSILVVMVWQYTGLAMVIFLAGLQGIPEELDEAGLIDGASSWRRFRSVTLPLLAPALTVSATLTLIAGMRVFDQILALTGGGPDNATETLATQVYEQTFANGLFGYGSALALVLALLVMVFALAQLMILRAREARV
jgi:raffinose/stachyose/melibiose transport system permease protein